MSKRELNRIDILARLDSGRLTPAAAAELLRVSERRHYKPNTAILEIGSISRIWFDAFRAQPPKQKHRRCDRAAIAEGEANPPHARPSPQADVSNDPYLGTP
jgi:hypothetical protein